MKRKDMLAAGAHSATFMGGIGENDALRNVAKGKDAKRNVAPKMEAKKVVVEVFRPTRGVLLVRRDVIENSSLIVTDTMEKEKPAKGIILELGIDAERDNGLSVGDHIVFGKYAGAEFVLNGETLLLMDATEVKGTVTTKK
jgi:chaperonin GroES